jgi:hypothetical protein
VDEEREGRGVLWWPDGANYVGEWHNDKRHGMGVQIWAAGEKFDGEWRND